MTSRPRVIVVFCIPGEEDNWTVTSSTTNSLQQEWLTNALDRPITPMLPNPSTSNGCYFCWSCGYSSRPTSTLSSPPSSSSSSAASLSVPLRCIPGCYEPSHRSLVCSWIRSVFTFPISRRRPLSYIALPLLDGGVGGGASPSVTRKLSIRPKSETTSSATNSFHSLFRMICLFARATPELNPPLDRGSS